MITDALINLLLVVLIVCIMVIVATFTVALVMEMF